MAMIYDTKIISACINSASLFIPSLIPDCFSFFHNRCGPEKILVLIIWVTQPHGIEMVITNISFSPSQINNTVQLIRTLSIWFRLMYVHLLSSYKYNSAGLNLKELVWKSLKQWIQLKGMSPNEEKLIQIAIFSQYKKLQSFPRLLSY
jgi:hypothetical protein